MLWDLPLKGTRFDLLDSSIAIWNQGPDDAPKSRKMGLNNGMAMLGVYAVVAAMTEGRFNPTTALISVHGKPVGKIAIMKKNAMDGGPVVRSNDTTRQDLPEMGVSSSSVHKSSSSNGPNNAAEVSGRYVDPTHPGSTIVYQFEDGHRIDSKDIYTCVMEALMILTYNDRETIRFDYLSAVSASHNTALHIHASGNAEPSLDTISQLVYSLSKLYTEKRRFDAMDFAYEAGRPHEGLLNDVKVAEGFYIRVGNGGRGNEGIAVASA